MPRRYLVGEIAGSPAWGSGIIRSWGCKYRASAVKLFERLVENLDGSGDVFLWDRERQELIARRNKSTPEQDQAFVSWYLSGR